MFTVLAEVQFSGISFHHGYISRKYRKGSISFYLYMQYKHATRKTQIFSARGSEVSSRKRPSISISTFLFNRLKDMTRCIHIVMFLDQVFRRIYDLIEDSQVVYPQISSDILHQSLTARTHAR